MAERKANPHPDFPNGYHIPVDAEKLAEFPHQAALTILVTPAHDEFEIFQKDIPSHLSGAAHQGKTVHWLNNFGFKPRGKSEYTVQVPEYTLLLERKKNVDYVYFDGKEIRSLVTIPHPTNENQVRAFLRLGDPPVGWVG